MPELGGDLPVALAVTDLNVVDPDIEAGNRNLQAGANGEWKVTSKQARWRCPQEEAGIAQARIGDRSVPVFILKPVSLP